MKNRVIGFMVSTGVVTLVESSRRSSTAFAVVARRGKTHRRASFLCMGLYDEPLPPRPQHKDKDPAGSSKSKNDDGNKREEDSLSSTIPVRLFDMLPDGTEQNGRLPRLRRSLESGVECYYEAEDRKVITLMQQTNCHVEDAKWALEACRGDVTEAWTRISTARRLMLNEKVKLPDLLENEIDWDAKFRNVVYNSNETTIRPVDQEAFQKRKEQRWKDEQKQSTRDFFRGGTPDEPWLLKENPKPIDDEPWFTG